MVAVAVWVGVMVRISIRRLQPANCLMKHVECTMVEERNRSELNIQAATASQLSACGTCHVGLSLSQGLGVELGLV